MPKVFVLFPSPLPRIRDNHTISTNYRIIHHKISSFNLILLNPQVGLNAGGFPFAVTEDNAELVKAKALTRLLKELKQGEDCAESYSEEETARILGVDL